MLPGKCTHCRSYNTTQTGGLKERVPPTEEAPNNANAENADNNEDDWESDEEHKE